MFRLLPVLLFVACALAGAEEVVWPDLPDPVGIGPRLNTIEWLRERKIKIPANADDATIVRLYQQNCPELVAAAAEKARAKAQAAEIAEQASILRAALLARFKVRAPEGLTVEQLRALLDEAENRQLEATRAQASRTDGDGAEQRAPPTTTPESADTQPAAKAKAEKTPREKQRDFLAQCTALAGAAIGCRVYSLPAQRNGWIDIFVANEDETTTYLLLSGYVRFANGQEGVLCLIDPGVCKCGNARRHQSPRLMPPASIHKVGTVPTDGNPNVYDVTTEWTRVP